MILIITKREKKDADEEKQRHVWKNFRHRKREQETHTFLDKEIQNLSKHFGTDYWNYENY